MARREAHCLVCGRKYTDYDAAPRFFCSVGCEADAGRPQPEPDPRVCAECPKQYTCPRAVREPRDLVESR